MNSVLRSASNHPQDRFGEKHLIVGTAGHIDHGKSALVEVLTGTHPDRLEEEKRRGITIDLGFAFLDLDGVRLGFVDVPGHERFVRNMLAGAGGIDLVLLVVAADESIKPQTREHFDICRLLAIRRGVVALTKSDLVDADTLGLVQLEIEEFVRGSFLEGAPIVPVSARTGAGIERLKQELRRVALDARAKDASRHFRLPIDRSFAVKGFGTVVTGTLISGSIAVEDEAELLPGGRRVRVRGIQSGGRAEKRAVAGQRTALNIAGVEHADVRRGMVLVPPGLFVATNRIDAEVELLTSARPIERRARVHFHAGAAETIADLLLLDKDTLPPGESALAQLHLAEPVVALLGDSFILRQFSPVVTIGGGVVLSNLAPRHRRRDAASLESISALAGGGREEVMFHLLASEPRGLTFKNILARTGWLVAEIRESADRLAGAGRATLVSDAGEDSILVVAAAHRASLSRRLREAVEAFHRLNPLAEGISKEELRVRLRRHAGPALFRAGLEELAATGELRVAGDVVKRAGREIALSADESRARDQIEQAFSRAGLAVPALKDVLAGAGVESKRAQKLLQILLREKVLVKITEDLVFHHSALARLRELLAGYKKAKGDRLPIAAFKELTCISRKYAIPLLEHLDRERVTRRVGDERVIL
jgi:selenocysteine-specific elongation factor